MISKNNLAKPKRTSEQRKYSSFIQSRVRSGIFETGQEIRVRLVKRYGISDSNARKVLSRTLTSGLIISSKPFTFGKGQYLYFVKDNSLFIDLIESLDSLSKRLFFRILLQIKRNHGLLSRVEALKIISRIEYDQDSQMSYILDDLLRSLIECEIISESKEDRDIVYKFLRPVQT